ncbi:MAG: carboxypeptidase regulatory-like domain-containing protein [Gammaproteobacteria bacterium]|nr:carboxypeptidase regulatory-like domain-containing protein [Gammaproteobacteria bacterium]
MSRILETNILHASDVIFWLDGSSAEQQSAMLRLPTALQLQLTTAPDDLRMVNGVGKTAFLRRPTTPIIPGVATAADRQPPVTPSYPIAGSVSDTSGHYLPRLFAIDAGNAVGHGLVIYPSPLGSKLGPAGGLLGTLRFDPAGTPAAWALLTLSVTTALGAMLTFRGQANGAGDFILPLKRLPPLPEGIASYSATLAVAALQSASASEPIDPADLLPMALGDLAVDATFSDPISLSLVPGEVRLIRSSSQDHLAVRPN